MSSNNQSISVSGMLKNMLDSVFTIRNCLSELIDDSQGAQATIIRIYLNNSGEFIISDNGCGMNRDEMKSCHCFHRRTTASNKHGRFGIGRKEALVILTQLKNKAQTISKSIDDSDISQMDLDFPTAIQKDVLEFHPHDLSVKTLPFWKKYAIDPESHGTITHFQADKDVMNDLLQMAKSKKIHENLSYSLGVIYHDYLKGGGKLELIVNGKDQSIVPIDILCWDQIKEDKLELRINVYINPSNRKEVRAYHVDPYVKTKEEGYCEHSNAAFKTDTPPKEFINLGAVTVRFAYKEDWPELNTSMLNMVIPGVKIPIAGEGGRQEIITALGGRQVKRNHKIIAHFPPTKENAGDDYDRKFYNQTNLTVTFNAVNEEKLPENDMSLTMDNLFRVGINKSHLEEDMISKPLWGTISRIKRKFGSAMKKKYPNPKKKSDDSKEKSYESDSDQSIVSVSSVESIPKRKKPQIAAVSSTSLPLVPSLQNEIIIPLSPVHNEAVQCKKPIQTKSLQAESIQIESSNQTRVSSYIREAPKSRLDILTQVYQLAKLCTIKEWEELINYNRDLILNESGLIDTYRELLHTKEIIQDAMQRMKNKK